MKVLAKNQRVKTVLGLLEKEYPRAGIALNYHGNWQLLVAVILSAQCTDERVNMVTPPLFKRFPEVSDFAECDVEELERLIYSTGFYRNKAKNIKAAAARVVEEFGCELPDTMEELLSLPGVARKTANVVLHEAFGKAEGVVVDTHVIRLVGLLQLIPQAVAKSKNAVRIEKELMKVVPREQWRDFTHLIIRHGRRICIARRPKCRECVLRDICPSARC